MPYGWTALATVQLPSFRPSSATSIEVAPSGTVTKYDFALLRCTESEAEKVYPAGAAIGVETTTVVMICRSMPTVVGSSTSRRALLMPAAVGAARTLTVTGWFSGRRTVVGPTTEKVSDLLFFRRSVCGTGVAGPVVRVMVTSYVFFSPAFRPPSRS